MIRLRLPLAFAIAICLMGVGLASHAGSRKSDGQVKARATGGKIDAQGRQKITIVLAINKGWHLYANPVNHNNDFLDAAQTKVTFGAKKGVKVESLKYPAGKTKVDGKEKYDVYEGVIQIDAQVMRTAGDADPLEITIAVQACDKNVCLAPAKVKLTVP